MATRDSRMEERKGEEMHTAEKGNELCENTVKEAGRPTVKGRRPGQRGSSGKRNRTGK